MNNAEHLDMMSYSCITYGDQTTAIQLLTNNHHATKMQKFYLFLI